MKRCLTFTVILGLIMASTAQARRHVLWGASFAPAPRHHGTHTRMEEARWFQRHVGVKFGVIRTYLRGFSSNWTRNHDLQGIIKNGSVPLFSFTRGHFTYDQISRGRADHVLVTRFRELRRAGNRNHRWRRAIVGFQNEPESKGGSGRTYVAAFQHIIHLAHRVHLPNKWTTFLMEWTWRNRHDNPRRWIPRSVDYLGVHGYATAVGTCGKNRRSFYHVFDGPYRTARQLGKPMLIGEAGFSGVAAGHRKARWFRNIPHALRKMPHIRAIAYWHSGGREGWFPGGCSWKHSYRIDSTWRAMRGYRIASQARIFSR